MLLMSSAGFADNGGNVPGSTSASNVPCFEIPSVELVDVERVACVYWYLRNSVLISTDST
jgi:hypothetical protein